MWCASPTLCVCFGMTCASASLIARAANAGEERACDACVVSAPLRRSRSLSACIPSPTLGQVELCQQGNTCAGLPPHACSAFGGGAAEYVLSISDPLRCEKCEGLLQPILLMSGVSAVLLLGFGAFIVLVVKYPAASRRSVSTATIFINHTQTVAILGSLHLKWPRSVQVHGCCPARLSSETLAGTAHGPC